MPSEANAFGTTASRHDARDHADIRAAGHRTHRDRAVSLALGAQPDDVRSLVIGHGLTLTLAGVALGIVAALALTRVMSGLLFGVTATDPSTFATVAGLPVAVALLACWLPARRATRVDAVLASAATDASTLEHQLRALWRRSRQAP